MIDGIDVVATLVPEEDVWQFEATETSTTETEMQDGEQESTVVVDYEDPSATEAIEANVARTGESSIQKKCERDEPKRCERLMNSKSKWRSMNLKCRLSATEVNIGESRSDTFAATPPLKFVRLTFELASELQAQASKRVDDHRCV